jgi:LAS superfamily LD-carboxypeptidase LdcB
MPTDTEQLVVSLEARIKDFERNFQRANRTSSQNFKAIEAQAKRSAEALEKSMSGASKGVNMAMAGLKGGIAGLVAGLSVGAITGIASRLSEITKSVANIGNEAKRAGLSAKAFQELGHVATQNRIPIDALVDGMKELNLRADEFIVTGGGSAADAFKRLGFSAAELKRKLEDPSALLVEIMQRMEGLNRAAQIRIADELFGGTGGERFVELLDRGAAGIRQLIAEANEFGLVLDDDVIKRADEIDRKFNLIASTVGTNLKSAVVDVVSAMDDFLDRFNKLEEQSDRNVQTRLVGVYDELKAAKDELAGLQLDKAAFPEDFTIDANIDRQKERIEELTNEALKLRDILDRRNGYSEGFIYKTGEEAQKTKPPLDDLSSALGGTGSAASKAVDGITSYADAIRSLKDEVPGLAKSLAELDAKARIDAVHRKALSMAQGQREIALANEMRGSALRGLNLKSATDDPSSYLSSVLASGKAASHITGMQSEFQQKLATMIANLPDDLKGQVTVNSGYRSPERQQELWLQALQKYGSPEAARKWVAPPGNSQHNKGNAADLGYGSDAARSWVHQNAGQYGLSFPMGHEPWHIEDEDARSGARSAQIDQQTQALTQQAEAYKQIVTEAQQFTQSQSTEQQALGMTAQAAQALRYEQQMLADAQRQGIAVTPQQRSEIQQLAAGMAQAEAATTRFAQTQQDSAEMAQMFGNTAVDALSGILTGTMTAEQALASLGQQLLKLALQGMLMGQGPLGGGGGGLFGWLFGGMKDGGPVKAQALASGGPVRGPGTSRSDDVPAWLSDGEYVVNAAATRKNRAALEAINSGKVPSLDHTAMGRGSIRATTNQVSNVFSPTIPITVQASGNKETDAALSKRLNAELSTMLDNKMTEFVQKQQRPGAMMHGKRFV